MKVRYLVLSAAALLVSACTSTPKTETAPAPEQKVYKWEASTYYLQRVSH